MATIEIPREVDRFVLYFDTPRREVNAFALATSLIGLADAVREANAIVNPGYRVEVVVEALESGVFAPNGRPVSLFLGLIVSKQANERHLKLLGTAAEMLAGKEFRDRLKASSDAPTAQSVLAAWPATTR